MKRSEINQLVRQAEQCFEKHDWALPPEPRWDVTDFGLGDVRKFGLVLVNLAEEPEYCEKLMYARAGMVTPAHCHKKKKEDIICRWGQLRIRFWKDEQLGNSEEEDVTIKLNGREIRIQSGDTVILQPGHRVTISPPIYHEFEPVSDECIIGEVSTANDDAHDNFFVNPDIGRFPEIDEDEDPLVRLVSDNS